MRSRVREITADIESVEVILQDLLFRRYQTTKQPVTIKTPQTDMTLSKVSNSTKIAVPSMSGLHYYNVDNFLIPETVLRRYGDVTAKVSIKWDAVESVSKWHIIFIMVFV